MCKCNKILLFIFVLLISINTVVFGKGFMVDFYDDGGGGCSHSWIGATCTEPKTCSKCKKTEGSSNGHSFNSKIMLIATCAENGVEKFTCTACKKSYTRPVLSENHKYGEYIITRNPTCEENGAKERSCDLCGKKDVATIRFLGHQVKMINSNTLNGGEHIVKCTRPGCNLYRVEAHKPSATGDCTCGYTDLDIAYFAANGYGGDSATTDDGYAAVAEQERKKFSKAKLKEEMEKAEYIDMTFFSAGLANIEVSIDSYVECGKDKRNDYKNC